MTSNDQSSGVRYQDPVDIHDAGADLAQDDQVIFNDRERPLTVTGRHKRQNSSSTWRRRGVGKYYDVIELEGNGTEYHLLCLEGAEYGPMLYREANWDEDKTDQIGQTPKYSRMGERVERMVVIDE